jgi:uncharacterized protein
VKLKHVQALVAQQLKHDKTGHGVDHIERVLNLSLTFANQLHADQDTVALIALLHDVDDYKLVGVEKASTYEKAIAIMKECVISANTQHKILESIKQIGYSRYLEGIRPTNLEGQIVSDADMCDAIGANGLLRVYAYGLSKGQPFFNREVFPLSLTDANQYRQHGSQYTIHHFFDKLLKLKDLMMTEPGKKEAIIRHQYLIDFLNQFFREEHASAWIKYLSAITNNQ